MLSLYGIALFTVTLWLVLGLIYHTYFEKKMRTPYIIMKKSAMSENQRMSILSNELVRRLSNIHPELRKTETLGITEHYTAQLKKSGYERRQVRDVLLSGLVGWTRKIERRQKDGIEFYREAQSTLGTRTRKKLMEKSTWFKRKRIPEGESSEGEMSCKRQRVVER